MSESVIGPMAAESDRSSAPEEVNRDELTAGLVLASAIIADPAVLRASEQAVVDFRATVLQPLLNEGGALAADREQVLRWAYAFDGPALLEGLALAIEADLAHTWTSNVSAEDVSWDLMKLADRIAGRRPSEPLLETNELEVLIDGPGGRCFVLEVRHDKSTPFRAVFDGTERMSVEAAVQTVMAQFPGILSTAAPTWEGGLCVCWPPGIEFALEATALPMALRRLSEITGLRISGLLSAGQFDGENFKPLEPPQLRSRTLAAKAVGRELLVPTTTGWQRIPADGTAPQRIDALRTLDGVASVVWGEDWAEWKREAHAEELARLGWFLVDWRQAPGSQPIPDHRVIQVGQLERYCLDKASPGSLILLGGTAHSGKSAIVRQLGRSLNSRKRPWLVQMIAGLTRELPDRNVALQVASHALMCAKPSEKQATRRLLVFEDLQPISGGNASEVLRYVAEQSGILVLGVLEYTHNSPTEWNTDNAFVATSVVSHEQRKQFVQDLAAANAALDPIPALQALDNGAKADLRMLTILMSGDPNVASRRSDRFTELSDQERAALVRTAAVSLVNGEVCDDELAMITDSDRMLFGVQPGRSPSTVRLASAEECVTLLDLYTKNNAPPPAREPRWRTINSAIAGLLEPELSCMLRDGDHTAAQRLDGVRLFHQDLCRVLLKIAADNGSLQEWAAAAPLISVIRMTALVDLMPEQAARELVNQMVSRVCRGGQQWSSAQLLNLIRACQQVEFLLSSAALDELVLWLVDSVDHAIDTGDGRPDERFALLTAIERLNRDEAMSVIAERSLDVLAGLTVRVDDYRLVQRVNKLHRRAVRRAPTDVALFPVDQENPVQFLLQHKPDSADGVGALLEAMNLKVTFGRDRAFDRTFEEYEIVLNQALRSATASELAQALQGIRSPIPQFCTWLLWQWPDFPSRARDLMWRSAGATDAAALLNAVARSGLSTAFKLLDDRPDDQLANVLAKRAANSRDAKGIGLLLSAAQSIEAVFGRGGDGFCTEMVEAVGEDTVRALIQGDPRSSIRYYIIKGVWDANASYRGEILDTVLSAAIDSVRRGRKHWGPEIALRLALDPEMGTTALNELRARIPPEVLLSGMTSAITGHGRALYHRLGRALHPEIPSRFLRQWSLTPFAEGLATSSPTAALEVCLEVSRTLTDADVPDAGVVIVAATGGTEQWARKLRFGRQQEAFAQTIRDLTSLDRATAGEVLEKLRDTPSQITIGGHSADALLVRLRHAMLDGPTAAPAILRAVHEVRPQLATDLLTDIMDDQHATFVFRGEIQQLQDPVAQSVAVCNLIKAGITRGSDQSAWIEPIFNVLIQVLRYFTGPRSVTSLLRMLSTWDQGWGSAGAQAVGVARIRNRLRYGALTDVADAIELARTLAALNNEAAAQQILEELLGLDVIWTGDHLDVSLLCSVIDVSQELVPDAVPRLARALARAVQAFVGRSVIFDEREHWLKVGRACRVLRQTGAPVMRVGEARIAPNIVYAPAVAWAATGLNQPGWGDDALGRAAARLAVRPNLPEVTDRACVLSATSRGWAPELRAQRTDWDVATAPFWLLRILYAEEKIDSYIAPILAAYESTIIQRSSQNSARADWDASRLRLILSARAFAQTKFRPTNRPDGPATPERDRGKWRDAESAGG